MSDGLRNVFEKASADIAFAKEVFADPSSACEGAGINLNPAEAKILADAVRDIQKYLVEKLFVACQAPDVLWNAVCGPCASL